jgi:DNA-binding transcriptional ArsR family regulator
LPNATLSFHLKELSRAAHVSSRRAGRFVYYRPVLETVNELVNVLIKTVVLLRAVYAHQLPQ